MKKIFAAIVLKIIGWKVIGVKPTDDKLIVVVMHHTSNWDFPLGILNRWYWGIFVAFAIKSSMFKPPIGWVIKALGGFPIERNTKKKKDSVVSQIVEKIKKEDKIMFNIAPEGTRGKVKRLKSGFYRIAVEAGIKIVLVDFNATTKIINWDKAHIPKPTFKEELQFMKAFYKDSKGINADQSFDFDNI